MTKKEGKTERKNERERKKEWDRKKEKACFYFGGASKKFARANFFVKVAFELALNRIVGKKWRVLIERKK